MKSAFSAVPEMAPSGPLSSQVELYVSAKGLEWRGMMTRPSPFVVLSEARSDLRSPATKAAKPAGFREVAKTETIMTECDPAWTKQIVMDFCFEEVQP